MRTVPRRPASLQLLAVFGGFLVGPAAALALAATLTPGSAVVATVAVPAFALIFAGGSVVWLGLGIVGAVLDLVRHAVLRAPRGSEGHARSGQVVPPGYSAFLVGGVLMGGATGVLAFLVTPLTFVSASLAWTALGGGYGALLWAAARQGFLPFDPT